MLYLDNDNIVFTSQNVQYTPVYVYGCVNRKKKIPLRLWCYTNSQVGHDIAQNRWYERVDKRIECN